MSLSCGRSDKHDTSLCGLLRAYVRGELCSPVWVALVFESVLSSMRWIPFFFFASHRRRKKTHNNSGAASSITYTFWFLCSEGDPARQMERFRNPLSQSHDPSGKVPAESVLKAEAKVYPGRYKLMRAVTFASRHCPAPKVKGPFLLSPVGQISYQKHNE